MNVGVTQRFMSLGAGVECDGIDRGFYNLLKGHNIIPIRNDADQDFDALADELDLLIVSGGMNYDIRIITETEISLAMVTQGKPVWGICHGAFLLTQILEGDVVEGSEECQKRHWLSVHTLELQGETALPEPPQVVSSHTMFIGKLPPGAVSLAKDPEGRPEAWIKGNICATVWHPERAHIEEIPVFIPDEIKEATGITA